MSKNKEEIIVSKDIDRKGRRGNSERQWNEREALRAWNMY